MFINTKKNNTLFRIVEKMNATEKAYFKKFGIKNNTSNSDLILLFDLIDKSLKKNEALQEPQLIKQFSKKSNARYNITKSRLTEHLLNSLSSYDKNNNYKAEIFSYIEIADSLAKRNLFEDSYNILQKAHKLASDVEEIELMLMIQHDILSLNTFISKYTLQQLQESSLQETLQLVDKLKNKYEAELYSISVLYFQKIYGAPKNENELTIFKQLCQSKFYKEAAITPFVSSNINIVLAKCVLYFVQNNLSEVIKTTATFIDQHIKLDKKLSQKIFYKSLSLYDSLLQSCLLSLQFPLFESYLKKFDKLQPNDFKEGILKKSIQAYLKAIYFSLTNQPEKLLLLSQQFKEISEEYYVPNYRKISLAYYLMFGSYLFKNYRQCGKMILWLRSHQHLGIRSDIEIAMWHIELIMLIEEKNYDLFSYKMRSYQEYIKKQHLRKELPQKIVQYLKALAANVSKIEQEKVSLEFLEAARQIVIKQPGEAAYIASFDILCWAESKYLLKESFLTGFYKKNRLQENYIDKTEKAVSKS